MNNTETTIDTSQLPIGTIITYLGSLNKITDDTDPDRYKAIYLSHPHLTQQILKNSKYITVVKLPSQPIVSPLGSPIYTLY